MFLISTVSFFTFLDDKSDYQRVYDLEHHVDDLEPEDLFQYIVTAVLLGLYLEQRTKFFTTCDTTDLENLSLTPNKDRTNLMVRKFGKITRFPFLKCTQCPEMILNKIEKTFTKTWTGLKRVDVI